MSLSDWVPVGLACFSISGPSNSLPSGPPHSCSHSVPVTPALSLGLTLTLAHTGDMGHSIYDLSQELELTWKLTASQGLPVLLVP